MAKKTKQEEDDPHLAEKIRTTRDQALKLWIKQMEDSADAIYQDLYGVHWEEGRKYEGELLQAKQAEARKEGQILEGIRRKREEARKVSLVPSTVFKDDWDPRY